MALFHHQALSSCPDFLELHRRQPENYPCLLESVAHGTAQSRFDILFAFPGDTLTLNSNQQLLWQEVVQDDNAFLPALDRAWDAAARELATAPKIAGHIPELPFTGGWFVFLSYELAQQIEPGLGVHGTANRLPIAQATRIPAALIYDHHQQCAYAVAEAGKAGLIDRIERDCAELASANEDTVSWHAEKIVEEDPQQYLQAVKKIQHYIREGDVFQVNISRCWDIQLDKVIAPSSLYRKLKSTNPSPFAGLAQINRDQAVISSSPERLLQRKGNRLCTRPIAGTHPRAQNAAEDQDLSQALLQHPKERAEHVMLIDLERNDLGRVCQPGSVHITECMGLESYRHVHHIVSEVCGIPRDDCTPGAILRALFPGGTITGCPKVRTMEIIAELEATPREAYTGSMGFINHNGDMDFNILIRSMVLDRDRVTLRAGAGIVADSRPQRELQETRAKAKGMLNCFQSL